MSVQREKECGTRRPRRQFQAQKESTCRRDAGVLPYGFGGQEENGKK